MSTRYNTGNPIESTDVRDMSDNAKNFDEFSVSAKHTFSDRLGVTRKTIRGMNAEFDYQILSMGFARVGTFATGATLTNPRQVLLWDIADGGDGQEYGWSGSFLPSGKVVPPGSTPLTTGGISVGAWISRYDPAFKDQLSQSIVYVRMYAAVWDGVVNNTDAIRAAHQAANLFNATVSYAGIKHYAIDGDARIPVNTNVEFCGARAHILNGIVGTPSFSTFQTTYLVEDPNTPVVNATGTFTGSLASGSITPTKGLFDGDGFAVIKTDYKIPDRAGTGVVDYEQSFCVVRDGLVTRPLSANLSANTAALTVKYRKNTNRITLNSPAIVVGGFNNLHFIDVSRCNVAINGFLLDFNAVHTSIDTINELIFLNYAASVYVNDVNASGQYKAAGSTVGSYVLKINYAAEVHVNAIRSIWKGWYSTASFHVNGLYVTNSVVNRVDAHAGGHNIYVDGCALNEVGVEYGWGGGEIKVTNCSFIRLASTAGCVATRGDYSGTFFGDISMDNCTIFNEFTSFPCIMKLEIGASTQTYMPGAIHITNVKWSSNNTSRGGGNKLTIFIQKLAGAAGSVVAPSIINIDGISAVPTTHLKAVLDYGNFIKRDNIFRFDVVIRNVIAGQIPAKGECILITDGGNTDVPVFLDVSNCDYILVNAENSNCLKEVTIADSGVCGVDTLPASANSPQVRLNDCEFRYPATGYPGNVPIGGAAFGSTLFTRIQGGQVYKSGFDLSNIAACQGLLVVKSGSTAPTLPAGWVFNDLFVGKKTTQFE